MKPAVKIFIAVILIVIIGFVGFRITGSIIDPEPGQYDDFAQCLTDKEVKMYGAYWCSHCKNQKEMFGSSWQYVDYVECDPKGNNANPEACDAAEIKGYPTWVFGNGEKVAGELTFNELSSKSGCSLSK